MIGLNHYLFIFVEHSHVRVVLIPPGWTYVGWVQVGGYTYPFWIEGKGRSCEVLYFRLMICGPTFWHRVEHKTLFLDDKFVSAST